MTDTSRSRYNTYHPVTGGLDLVTYGNSGPLASLAVDYTWDTALRPAGYEVSGGGPVAELGYDTAGRLETVDSYGSTHTHGYIAGTGTLASLTTHEGSSLALTRTLYHDRMGRLFGINTANASGTPLSRHGYWKQITGDNSSGPLWSSDSVVSGGVTLTGHAWTPEDSVNPAYDFDGNLTNDGRWDYTWDAENRLIRMQTTNVAANAGVPRQRLDFVYDWQGRRVSKTVSTSTNGTDWTFASALRFLYDGWNLIAEYSPLETGNLKLETSYLWGLDLSGTPQGAGGVGGLLAVRLLSSVSESSVYPAFDGNGNISAWIGSAGTVLARMDYSPFGQLISHYKFTSDATLARLPFGFSTKYTDPETGLLYYGHRYYDPVNGRWPSRDPIEEEGGLNLYGFLMNDGANAFDLIGLVGNKQLMLDTIHQGSMKAHKAAEVEYLDIIRSSNPTVITKDVNRGKPYKPYKPREYGGYVCEKCLVAEDRSKKTRNG